MMSLNRPVSKRALSTAVVMCGAMILGCMERSVTGPAVVGSTDALTVTAGNNQSGTVSNALSTPLTIQIKNSAGVAVPNAQVSFVVASGGGAVSPAIVNTDATGIAQATWTLGTNAGSQSVIASAGALAVTFSATGIAVTGTGTTTTTTTSTPAQVVLVSGAGQSGTIGQPLTAPVVVKVVDAAGNSVSGASVAWSLDSTTATGNGSGTSSSPGTSITDVSGQASTTWILGAKVGQQKITATVGTLKLVVNATGQLSSSGAILIGSTNPQTAQTNAALPAPIAVLVLDQNGNPAFNARVTWVVQTGGGTLSKASGTTSSAGIDNAIWTLGPTAGAQTATATVANVGSVTFNATASTIGGTATTLRIVSGNGQVGQSAKQLALPLVAEVLDANGSPLPGVTVSFAQSNSEAYTSPTSVASGADGRVSVTWTLATNTTTTAQAITVTASLPSFASVPTVTYTATVRPAFRIRIPAANIVDTMQTDTTGATLKDTLFVQVYDPVTDKGVQGIAVRWATQASTTVDGFAVNSADTTDNTGLARNRWVLRSSADGAAIPSGPVAKRMVATAVGVGQVEFKARVYPGAMRSVTATLATASPAAAGSGITWCATPRDATGNVIDSAVVTYTGSGGGSTVTATQISRLGGATCNTSTVTKAGTWFFGLTVLDSVRPYHKPPPPALGLVIQWPVTEAAGTLVVSPGAVSSMAIASGNSQTATRGTTLPTPIRVLVTDIYGNAVPGTTVSFAVVAGAGLLSAGATPAATATVTTGADGTAAVTWTLGAAAGTNTVTVAAGGAIVIFTATGN